MSGGVEGALPVMRSSDLVAGCTTLLLQIPLIVLPTIAAVGRVLVSALPNTAYQAGGKLRHQSRRRRRQPARPGIASSNSEN